MQKSAARKAVKLVRDAWKRSPDEAYDLAKRLGSRGAFKDTLPGTQFLPPTQGQGLLGAGMEGSATLALGPRGIDVRKHFYPEGPLASKKMQARKVEVMQRGNPALPALHQHGETAAGDTIHRMEWVRGTPLQEGNRSRERLINRVLGDVEQNVPRGARLGDVHFGNVLNDRGQLRIVDFIPAAKRTPTGRFLLNQSVQRDMGQNFRSFEGLTPPDQMAQRIGLRPRNTPPPPPPQQRPAPQPLPPTRAMTPSSMPSVPEGWFAQMWSKVRRQG